MPFTDKYPTLIALMNLLLLVFMVVIGAVLGGVVRRSKSGESISSDRLKDYMIGVGASFICLPFIASFLHLNYESLILPLGKIPASKYIEQVFTLVSLSGVASYLGYGLLDNIANKVLQNQVNDLGEKQSKTAGEIVELQEENKRIKENERKINIELLYMRAKDAVASAEKFEKENTDESKIASLKKYNDALGMLEQAIDLIENNKKHVDYDRLMVMKAYVLKRVDKVEDALVIIETLLEADCNNPVLIYNKGCYMLLAKKCDDIELIKNLIITALTIKTNDDIHKTRQKKLIKKVLSKLDNDIKCLFTEDELTSIKKMTSEGDA